MRVVDLRHLLLVPMDKLLAITGELINVDISRLGRDRCLPCHRVSDLKRLQPQHRWR
ncbi:hypothetical protein NTGM5_560041 [Candidatus Nitrotoga sp. M5]|nr:hypothetical protein NTGM5_560041 [Candidatus Nitrotoga sp. M5]